MTIAPRSFLYQFDAVVATITLNRPDRLNALTFQVYEELRDVFRALDSEAGVRAIVITGSGRAFCSGGDVEDIIGQLFSRDAKGLLDFTWLTCDLDRKSTRLNSSHPSISYAVFCLKKKKKNTNTTNT